MQFTYQLTRSGALDQVYETGNLRRRIQVAYEALEGIQGQDTSHFG